MVAIRSGALSRYRNSGGAGPFAALALTKSDKLPEMTSCSGVFVTGGAIVTNMLFSVIRGITETLLRHTE